MQANELKMPIKGVPFDHQQRAFDFACDIFGLNDFKKKSSGVGLLMEMGCGKTLVAIAIIGILYRLGLITRVIITAPLSLLGVWESEFEAFADFDYSLTVLKGTSAKKKEAIANARGKGLQVIVVNYESAWRLEKELLAFGAECVCCDEGHKIKEGRTAQSKGMHHLGDKADYKLLLTGTLITNREIDVFSQYRFLDPRVFGVSFYPFRNRYFYMGGYGQHTPIFKKSMLNDFLQRMHSIAFRTTKKECLDLPAITEEVRSVELEPKAMKIYKELEDESYTELKNGEVTAPNILTKLLRLSQVTGGHLTDDEQDTHLVSTVKLAALEDIIDAADAENQKIVVMARFVPELNDIQTMLEKKNIGYAVVRGGVKDRAEEVRRFQEDDNCRVFVG